MSSQTIEQPAPAVVGADRRPLGVLTAFGAKPEDAWDYDGPVQPGMTNWTLQLESTHDSLERTFVPAPLQVDRTVPAVLTVVGLISPRRKKMGGVPMPFAGLMFNVPASYTDSKGEVHRGSYNMEYISSINAEDQTTVADWGCYGQTYGVYKPLADIYITPDGDKTVITVNRHGKRIVNFTIERGDEVDLSDTAPTHGAASLTLREIPNVNFTGYVDRSVCLMPASLSKPTRLWRADATIELFNDTDFALGDLDIRSVRGSSVSTNDVSKEIYREHHVIEQLPL